MSDDDGRKSKFNAGVALVSRVDILQQMINSARMNPIAMDLQTMTYNFMVMINANDGLLDEAWGKLSDSEREKGLKIKNLARDYADTNPPIVMRNGELVINRKNYRNVMDIINIYCQMIKDFLDNHNLNAPDDSGDEGL